MKEIITPDTLRRISPHVTVQRANTYAKLLNDCMQSLGLTETKSRMAMFLAQILHESGHLRYTEEIASGEEYERRTDIGNTSIDDGDGPRYKGRGLLQITGRANYEQMGRAMGLDLINHPEMLATPANAVLSACTWWSLRGAKINPLADAGKIQAVTKIINGGLNGIVERENLYKRAMQVL